MILVCGIPTESSLGMVAAGLLLGRTREREAGAEAEPAVA